MTGDDGLRAADARDDGDLPPLAEQLSQSPAIGRIVLHHEVKPLSRLVFAHHARSSFFATDTTIQVPGSEPDWQYAPGRMPGPPRQRSRETCTSTSRVSPPPPTKSVPDVGVASR